MVKLDKQRRNIILVSGISIVILVVITVLSLQKPQEEQVPGEANQPISSETEDSGVHIGNISDYTKGKPQNDTWLSAVEKELLKLLRKNSDRPGLAAKDVAAAVVREGSYSQIYDGKTGVSTVDFIVDVPSLKQSYGAHYEWGSDGGNDPDIGMRILSCLPSNQLIYEKFACKDAMVEQYGWPSYDDILEYLPYHDASNYYIYPDRTTSGGPLLVIHLNTPKSNATLGERYKNEALNRIRNWGLDPDNYDISFEYGDV
jgi:hypothetical protein